MGKLTLPHLRGCLITSHRCWEPEVPIVLYAADFPYTAYTNLSFIVTSVTNPQVTDLSNNGLALFSQDSNRLAEGWTQCIACAAIDRSLGRLGWARPEACENCFKKHCWDGTVEDSQPSFLEPALVLNLTLSWGEWNATVFYYYPWIKLE
jgi:lysophospholipase